MPATDPFANQAFAASEDLTGRQRAALFQELDPGLGGLAFTQGEAGVAKPGRELHVHLEDRRPVGPRRDPAQLEATELCAQELVLPALGVTREVDLLISAQPRPFRGRVTTHDGAPLAGADLTLGGAARDGWTWHGSTRSSADGTFVFDDVYTNAPVRVVARHKGFAPLQREEIAPAAGGEEVVFRLPPARRVTVRVVDRQGMAVPAHTWRATEEDLRHEVQRIRPGESVFADLPPGVVTFACIWEGRQFELKHDTAQEEAVFRVP
jgi:hypothetical protein